jgi:hypothetical protein
MDHRPNHIERAFQLARTGKFSRKSEIIKALSREGYGHSDQMLDGRLISRQLRDALNTSQQVKAQDPNLEEKTSAPS